MMRASTRADLLSLYRLVPAGMHLGLAVLTWILAATDARPLLDGRAKWSTAALMFVDFPVSAVAFSLMWDGLWVIGATLWGVAGTLFWYLFAGVLFRPGIRKQLQRSQSERQNKEEA